MEELNKEEVNTSENIEQEETKTAKKESKKSKESKKIEELTNELTQKSELLLRTAAEFDNFKRRTERERLEVYERSAAEILKKLLPIIDNAERASAAEKGGDDYNKGIEMIAKQLFGLSENLGLIAIGEVGEAFNPDYHEAIMHIEDENLPENSVSAVMQKGYKYGNTVIRPAMVAVAN